MEELNKLLNKILDKKELRSLNKEYAKKILDETILENEPLYENIAKKGFNERSKEYKELLKIVRKKLRTYFGSFNAAISNNKKKNLGENIVFKHLSTRERAEHIDEFVEFVGKTKSILDLGCGYNPYFYKKFLGQPKYLASDISDDLKHIKKWFESENIDGDVVKLDLVNKEDIAKLKDISKEYETVFMLKLLDPLENQKRNITKKIFENIHSKYIIVSFSTMSIGGKTPIKSERSWFYNIIRGENFEEKVIGTEKYIKITGFSL
ncbi:MAG: hypothetical protein ACMXX9_04560 [Candidatus Woesearchaeota archaeon]